MAQARGGSGLRQTIQGLEEGRGGYLKRLRKSQYRGQAAILLALFDMAQMSPMHTENGGQFFLAEATAQPGLPDGIPKGGKRI
jgi:hypothetical protein